MSSPEVFEVRTIDSTPGYSHAEVTLKGINRRSINHGGDSFYRCIGGSVVFHIGNSIYPTGNGETVFVPRGVPYQGMSSLGATLEVCTVPPYDPSQITYLSK